MLRRTTLLAALALIGCGPPSATNITSHATPKIEDAAFPIDNGSAFLSGYRLQVPKQGVFLWNSLPIEAATLTAYLREYSKAGGEADRLVVEFEPGTPSDRIEGVRRQVRESGLCRQNRCAEAPWRVKRPVVY